MADNNTILIIDDDAHIIRVLEIKLKNNGYTVITAKNGAEGLSKLLEKDPRVVITDINMPKLDGKNLCLVTNDQKKKTPFLTIVITARINPDDTDWVKDLTDTIFMEKPFSPTRILDCVNAYCKDGKI